MKHKEPRTLTLDLETAPLEGYVWQLFDQNVGLEQIKTEWSILSYAAKWLDSKKVIYEDTSGRGAERVRDDKPLMAGLWELLDAADIVVGQNVARFDLKKVNARFIVHGLKPYSPVRVVDTLLVAKKHFGFTSNKLAWMSEHLTATKKSEHKQFPGFELWKECLADNPKAWAEMKRYNKLDVVATEELYRKMLPWISNHPNLNVYSKREGISCPKCDSPNLQARGFTVTQGGRYQRLQCQACAGWCRGKNSLRTKASSAKQLVSIS